MYLQDIVINPDVFEKIKDDILEIDFKSYKKNLVLKRLVTSKEIGEKFKSVKESSNDLGKKAIEAVLKIFEKEEKYFHLESDGFKPFIRNNVISNALLNLAINSNSQIINSENKSIKLLLSSIPEAKNVEVLTINETINPPPESKLYCFNRIIKLKKGDYFNIYESLKWYWLNTTSLNIEDNYLRHKKRQFPLLIELIKSCKNLNRLEIHTDFQDHKQQKEIYYDQDDFEKELLDETGIKPTIISEHVDERHYFTDHFEIILGKGIDFFDLGKFKVKKNRITIEITTQNDS